MRLPALLILSLLVPRSALQGQEPADPLPLRPGQPPSESISFLFRCTPRAANAAACLQYAVLASRPTLELVSLDGHACPCSPATVRRLLLGEIGSTITLRFREADSVRTLRLVRTDVFAPGPGYSRLLLTPHFVVHYRPRDEERARSLAATAEKFYRRSELPLDVNGRRAHLWAIRDYAPFELDQPHPFPWGAWATGDGDPSFEYSYALDYIAYGFSGQAGDTFRRFGWVDANTLHRAAIAELQSNTPWANSRYAIGDASGASLREYIRQRYGTARLRQIWSADTTFDAAVRQTLGISPERLKADWRRHILSLGPNPAAEPTRGAIGVTVAWTTLLLLAGTLAARRREVE